MINLIIYITTASIVAMIGIILSSEIIEHNLELKHAAIMAFVANIITYIAPRFISGYFSLIPYGYYILNIVCWIAVSLIVMSESLYIDRIKIAFLGYILTQVITFILPYIGIII